MKLFPPGDSARRHPAAIFLRLVFFALAALAVSNCASRGAVSAEEYFSIGMAYYDMGKFDEAEKWLNRAKAYDKTKNASEYNLGRIAFAAGRYAEAAKHFEATLKRDPANVLALKAAAYTRIKTGEIEKAEVHYKILLELVPESADDGYNYALVLYAMKKYAEAEQVLGSRQFALLENNDVLLLYARAQKAQDKVEAIDSYAKWLVNNSDAKVRYEYAQLLEGQELYARALEECRAALAALAQNAVDPSKAELRFNVARLLLIAEGESADGITELGGAVSDGFTDIEAVEKLLADNRISAKNKEGIRSAVTDMRRAAEVAKQEQKAAAGSVSGVSVSPATLSLNAGGAAQTLTATIAPENAANKAVTWTSDNANVAAVNADGVVTPLTTGSATITATSADGGFTATCAVTVNPAFAGSGTSPASE